MNDTRFRVLLPTFGKRSLPPTPLPRRNRVSTACDSCRTRKIRCNGGKPCGTCQRSDSTCTYPNSDDAKKPTVLRRENKALREHIAVHQEILDHLQSMPPNVAQDVLRLLETDSDPNDLLEMIKNNTPASPSSVEERPPSPESPCHCANATTQPIAIPPIEPYKTVQPTTNTLPSFQQTFSSCIPPFEPSPSSTKILETYPSPESPPKPPRSNHQSDPLFTHLNISQWTTIPVSNAYAARAISSFLELSHPVGSVFGSSLFLQDLLDFKIDYCSSLMVNSLLAYASQTSDSLGPDAVDYSYAFKREAVALARERPEDSLPTVVGLVLLFMSVSSHAPGLEGLAYLSEAVDMAERLRVFGMEEEAFVLRRKPIDSVGNAHEIAWSLCSVAVHSSSPPGVIHKISI